LFVLADEQWLELELEKIPENPAALKHRTADHQIQNLIQVTAAQEIKSMKAESQRVIERRRIGNLHINAIDQTRGREAVKTKDDEDEEVGLIEKDRARNQVQDEIQAVLHTSLSRVTLIVKDPLLGKGPI